MMDGIKEVAKLSSPGSAVEVPLVVAEDTVVPLDELLGLAEVGAVVGVLVELLLLVVVGVPVVPVVPVVGTMRGGQVVGFGFVIGLSGVTVSVPAPGLDPIA
jgi:hypothetical protein